MKPLATIEIDMSEHVGPDGKITAAGIEILRARIAEGLRLHSPGISEENIKARVDAVTDGVEKLPAAQTLLAIKARTMVNHIRRLAERELALPPALLAMAQGADLFEGYSGPIVYSIGRAGGHVQAAIGNFVNAAERLNEAIEHIEALGEQTFAEPTDGLSFTTRKPDPAKC